MYKNLVEILRTFEVAKPKFQVRKTRIYGFFQTNDPKIFLELSPVQTPNSDSPEKLVELCPLFVCFRSQIMKTDLKP